MSPALTTTLGTLLLVLFAGVAAACISAANWVAKRSRQIKIPHADRWVVATAVNPVFLTLGTMFFGGWAIVATVALLTAEFVLFARIHDKLVPAADRALTRSSLNSTFRGLPARCHRFAGMVRQRFSRRSADESEADLKSNRGLGDRLVSLGEAISGSRAARKKTASAAAAAEALGEAVAPVQIDLLKKDGRSAFDMHGDDAMSTNVLAARKMLVDAMIVEATDIHFEPNEKQYTVRLRVDGVLQTASVFPLEAGRGVISALKVLADMDITERRRPQDGTFSAVFNDGKYDMRAACTPTSYGEKMVIRVLKSSGGMLKTGLANIGIRKSILAQLRDVIHKPYGMFLVTGPTGSGKTTTVYASLSEIDAAQHNITTIEDPVEYRLDGITQISVNSAAGVTFASILRSVLRQDPDVLLVGEIRDKETAEIACQAALTGHFVFSTLHANDTVATITRMLDLGLDATLIQTAVTAVLGQRLARKLCTQCRQAVAPPPDLLQKLGIKPTAVKHIYKERGCKACGNTGFKGRVGLHELLVMNDDIRGLIVPQPSMQDLRAAARRNKTRSLQTDGMLKVVEGITSISEVVRVTTA